jgi:tRNA dimethylallyltransferase
VDAPMLAQIDAKNPRRLARAIEVMEATGRSLSEWQDATPEPLVKEFTALWLQREKDDLHARMETRVEAMFAAGWGEEVRALVGKYGAENVKAFQGIGYREITELVIGSKRSLTLQEVKRNILVATRQYAKRQLTWFAREPKLASVMLTGHPSFSAALRAARVPDLF